MKLWLIVPVKPFHEGKSRLAHTLPDATRALLSRQLFHHVMAQAVATTVLSGILVVSRDPAVLDGCPSPKIEVVPEAGYDLNQALSQGRQVAVQRGADALLILPADLPRLQSADITALYQQSQDSEGIVIVPSADNGTNALLLRPPYAINFAFGRNSFAHHCRATQLAHLPCIVHNAPHLAFDVDLPADLARLGTDQAYAAYTSAALPQAWR